MKTYLLTWNPTKWEWGNLAELAQQVEDGLLVKTRWSCGVSKKLSIGDRIFMMRQGEEPRGIFASAYVVKGSYGDLHWDERKAKQGVTSQFVVIQFDHLLNPDQMRNTAIISRDLLKADPRFSKMYWDTLISGVKIPDFVAGELEKLWGEFASRTGGS